MISRIVLMTGGVETLTYFSKELGKTFAAEGYQVFYYDLQQAKASSGKLKRFLKPGQTVLVTFNYIGLCEEEFLYSRQYGSIWEQYRIPVYTIVVDHPLYYHEHLKNPLEHCYYMGADRKHINYVEQYYPKVKVRGFLPLAGTELEGRQPAKRDIPVLLTGNYKKPAFFNTYIERIDEEYTRFYHGIIQEMLMHPEYALEEVVKQFCIKEMGEISDEDYTQVLSCMNFIDLYIRNTRRGEVVKALIDNGVTVDVVGSGWEELDCIHQENLRVHSQADSETCLEMMGRAVVSLNVMPDFKDGAHDRIFNSILNGAVCVSDDSIYLKEVLPEGCGVSYYDVSHPEYLGDQIKALLEDTGKCREIQKTGYGIVKEKHTWKNRAYQLLDIFAR